jgi:hypothetical protein
VPETTRIRRRSYSERNARGRREFPAGAAVIVGLLAVLLAALTTAAREQVLEVDLEELSQFVEADEMEVGTLIAELVLRVGEEGDGEGGTGRKWPA